MKYMFRKTLLEEHGYSAVDQLVDYCLKNKIESCMIVTESHTLHPFPRPLEQLEKYCRGILSYAMTSLRKNGIEPGINIWFSIGCGQYKHNLKHFPEFNWDNYVDWRGIENEVVATPCSQKWRQYFLRACELFASTNPEYIFLDDDFRLHNHIDPECGFGSFDKHMLERYSAKLGTKVDRQKALDSIYGTSGFDSPRDLWFETLNAAMVETAELIRKAIHNTDPNIKIGLMSSDPETHSAEGRNWKQLLAALAGHHPMLNRPCMGNYRQTDFKNLVNGYLLPLKTINRLDKNSRFCAEIENAQGDIYGKSAKFMRAQMRLAILAGCRDLTLNLYNFVGQPLGEIEAFDRVLRQDLSYLKELEASCQQTIHSGVECVTNPHNALAKPNVTTYNELVSKSPWEAVLSYLGIAVSYNNSNIKALSGDLVRIIPVETLKEWLSNSVLLDSSAAKALCDMGFSYLIGIKVSSESDICSNIGCEETLDQDVATVGKRIDVRHMLGNSVVRVLQPLDGARSMTRLLVNSTETFGPGLVWYTNALGGKVATVAFDGQTDSLSLTSSEGDAIGYYSQLRFLIMQSTLRFLSRDDSKLCTVSGGAYVMPIRLEGYKYTLIALQNFHNDDFDVIVEVQHLPRKAMTVCVLDEDGQWTKYQHFSIINRNISLVTEIKNGQTKVFKVYH